MFPSAAIERSITSLKTTACVSKVRGQSLLNIQNIAFDLIMIFNSHTHGILLSGDVKGLQPVELDSVTVSLFAF